MWTFLSKQHNWPFLRFGLAQLISQFGDRVHQMALVGLIAQRAPGSSFELAKLLAFTIIPVFIIGPIAGVYVDRWDRKMTLFICDILRGLLVLAIAFILLDVKSIWPIYAAVFLIFTLSRFYVPAKMSFVPQMVEETDLHIANSLVTVTGMIALVLGALFGGLIVEWHGAKGGFVFDALTFFTSATLLFSVSVMQKMKQTQTSVQDMGRQAAAAHRTVWAEISEGVAYISAQKQLTFIFFMMSLLFAAAGAVYVVIIVFIQQSFGTTTKDLGYMAVPLGIGLFIGSMMYGRFGKNVAAFRMMFLSLMAGGLMMAVFSLIVAHTQQRALAMGIAALVGLVLGPVVIASNTVVHQICATQMSGKVFAALEFVMHLAFLAAMLLSSFAAEHVPRMWILVVVGVIFFGVGLIGLCIFSQDRVKGA